MWQWRDTRLERAWQRKWAADNAGLDAATSLQTLLFPSLIARTLWDHLRSGSSPLRSLELAWLLTFLAWAPLLLWLSQRRPAAYARLRTPLVLLSRLHRQLTIVRWSALFSQEAVGTGGSGGGGTWPTAVEGKLGLLLWRPGSMITLSCTYLLPLKYSAPCAGMLLLATLHSMARQCTLECRGAWQAQATDLYAGLAELVWGWMPWRLGAGSTPSAGSGATAAGACGAGVCGAGACRSSCIAVHALVETALGALLPLAVTWAVEERSRLRFQRLWLRQFAAASEPSGGGTSAPPAALAHPLSSLALSAWLLATTLVVWLLLYALVLPLQLA